MERRRAGEGDNEDLSQEARINRGINLDKWAFKYTEGLFHVVHSGKLMEIVKKFNTKGKVTRDNPDGMKYTKEDIQQLLFEPKWRRDWNIYVHVCYMVRYCLGVRYKKTRIDNHAWVVFH